MKVQIYKNIFGFANFLICVDNKEVFINNSFENIKIALICLEKNSIDRKEVWLNKIKGNIIVEQDLSTYINEYQESLNDIRKELEKRNIEYSWLQIMQLMVLNNEVYDFNNNISKLDKFYEEYISKEYII